MTLSLLSAACRTFCVSPEAPAGAWFDTLRTGLEHEPVMMHILGNEREVPVAGQATSHVVR